ncbi:CinA family protein [Thauera linaloolentis]|uniref:Damage inducible protein CinA n=1 Tax=Thauera linaloolentis (strain DSM 12138 / JCM 21573 / CCUG 41526 / CIP 105981 / IAM 15112 / NBRC 102519 / 47Lol) TaxID=1123367 RepID=N6YYK0_THAL4|nr:nicotinamide-nucleotide amidohydrolase family protein [Thauera linaloolentis]ENO85004.1 damage inducible protein CinA [Thauera linaloolentis 47Lol = DSM 12138]MCM8566816.1 nicotinamide-nucleotide amidohydrolase family protein [Thauera linaloolentis]
MDTELGALSATAGAALAARGWMLATAESCTGGWIAEAVTATSGSSAWFDRGFVTYSNAAKTDMLGVATATLAAHGAVSEATVAEMAEGALARSAADIAVAVSGIAGPGGGTPAKPVGTVCLAWARRGDPVHACTLRFSGDRTAVRRQTVIHALRELIRLAATDRG